MLGPNNLSRVENYLADLNGEPADYPPQPLSRVERLLSELQLGGGGGGGSVNAYSKAQTNALLANKADKATTLGGYGITDAYTKLETDLTIAAYIANNPYILAAATASSLGGVKIGNGINVAADGTISLDPSVIAAYIASNPYVLPTASSSVLGGVKVGSGITLAPDGTISVDVTDEVRDVLNYAIGNPATGIVASDQQIENMLDTLLSSNPGSSSGTVPLNVDPQILAFVQNMLGTDTHDLVADDTEIANELLLIYGP